MEVEAAAAAAAAAAATAGGGSAAAPPVKRRRGRPRKTELPPGATTKDAVTAQKGATDPTKPKKQRKRKGEAAPPSSVDVSMIGQQVTGVLDGTFDAGYLLSVRVGTTDMILRGVVFGPGLSVPISRANDVAPGVKHVRRDDRPLPSAPKLPISAKPPPASKLPIIPPPRPFSSSPSPRLPHPPHPSCPGERCRIVHQLRLAHPHPLPRHRPRRRLTTTPWWRLHPGPIHILPPHLPIHLTSLPLPPFTVDQVAHFQSGPSSGAHHPGHVIRGIIILWHDCRFMLQLCRCDCSFWSSIFGFCWRLNYSPVG